MVPWVFVLVGCLERVTGEDVPLDPRFYAGQQDAAGQPSDPHAAGSGEGPYAGYEGETWALVGEVRADAPDGVQIDVNEPDPTAPGGVKRAGAIRLFEPGPFEVNVPKTVAVIQLQAFQDPTADGPDESDPFAEQSVDLSAGPPEALVLQLVKGARGTGGGGGGGAPGSPGGAPMAGTPSPGPPPNGLSFPEGPMVTMSGTVVASRDLPVVLDFFLANGEGAGGRGYLAKRIVPAGPWTQEFPENFGSVEVEAYQDLTGDSRTGDDPAARLERAIPIAESDVDAGTLTIP